MNKDKIGVFGDSFADYEVFIQVFAVLTGFVHTFTIFFDTRFVIEVSTLRMTHLTDHLAFLLDP